MDSKKLAIDTFKNFVKNIDEEDVYPTWQESSCLNAWTIQFNGKEIALCGERDEVLDWNTGEVLYPDGETLRKRSKPIKRSEKKPKRKSRRVRFEELMREVEGIALGVGELRDELQEWLDNIPDSLQDGQKASELEEAISALEDVETFLDDAREVDVEFPGMISR
jgi:hypothetical protein